nr:MAG TPA: hypothetical protein [Caudoviricetes sp.]
MAYYYPPIEIIMKLNSSRFHIILKTKGGSYEKDIL